MESTDRYTFFEKTADAKFQAYGITLEESFKNAAEAMLSIMFNIEEIDNEEIHVETREISVEGESLEQLLYLYLEEIVFLMSAELFVGLVQELKIEKSEQETYTLTAVLRGSQVMNFESHGEVKAVTYNEMFVKYDHEKARYVSQVVVDL